MSNLTPSDVRSIAFKKPALGRRGYDEEEVDAFLDDVERTIVALTDEVASLRAQLGRGAPSLTSADTSGRPDGRVLAELEQINTRLARLELTVAGAGSRPSTRDPLFGSAG